MACLEEGMWMLSQSVTNIILMRVSNGPTGHENNIAEPKQISGLALHLIFHRFSPFNCCLNAVLWLDKGGYPEHSHSVVFCRS